MSRVDIEGEVSKMAQIPVDLALVAQSIATAVKAGVLEADVDGLTVVDHGSRYTAKVDTRGYLVVDLPDAFMGAPAIVGWKPHWVNRVATREPNPQRVSYKPIATDAFLASLEVQS